MIQRLLVANRAEIASRVFRTCRRLGIETVAVHSDADADLPYVVEADLAVRLPGTAPADTYLRGDLLVEAAIRAGVDAVHPGYGFLSESAAFARAVVDAGLTWVGPAPASIELMGSKVEAKRAMAAAGVPVLSAPDEPGEEDLPLIVKASAGGGGRGMRVVRSLAELPAAVEAASAEAASAFGDGTVFVEPYVEHGRHVEVQVWGDHHGNNVSVLGARDCSLQRRHQKVVEESPPPGLTGDQLDALYSAARDAAHAIAYVGAGTVEFLVDAEDPSRFWFLEMNTRLQVEHPVTEAVLGIDLVELQIAAAEDPTLLGVTHTGESGHAIEVRLYAEDPADGYRPQSGVLTRFDISTHEGLRVDAGYAAGSEVSTHYDAMLAKVICHAPTREAAIRRLAAALSRARIHGVVTNRDFLVAVLRSEEFRAGRVSTSLLGSGGFETLAGARSSTTGGRSAGTGGFETLAGAHSSTTGGRSSGIGGFETLAGARSSTTGSARSSTTGGRSSGTGASRSSTAGGFETLAGARSSTTGSARSSSTGARSSASGGGGSSGGGGGAGVAAALALAALAGVERTVQQGIPTGWRNVVSLPQRTVFDDDTVVEWWGTRDGLVVDGLAVVSVRPDRVVLEEDGVRTAYDVAITGEPGREVVDVDSVRGHVRLTRRPRFADPADAVASGSLLAPMPGTVVGVAVQEGDEVAAGDVVLVLEAMKMQHPVTAPHAGTVTQIGVQPGAQVAAGEVLAVVEES